MAAALRLFSPLLLCAVYAAGQTVDVYPQNCTESRPDNNVTLNGVLNGGVQSDTHYRLLPGTHCIVNFSYVQDLRNLTFSGDCSHPELVNVACTEGSGLAFINITTLTLEGMAITDCGVTGQDWDLFESKMQRSINFFYKLQPSDVVAVVAGVVEDLTLRRVTINSTKGLGMLVVNPKRSCLVEESVFSGNAPLSCYRLPLDNGTIVNLPLNNRVGGGALFVFLDYSQEEYTTMTSLVIRGSTFLNNSYCGLQAKVALNYRLTHIANELGYSLGAGGGLSVVLAQSTYQANVAVHSNQFCNNTSFLGGGAHIAMFEGVSGNNVTFYNCTFSKNGLAGEIISNPQFYTSGSALYIVKDLIFPTDQASTSLSTLENNTILIQDSRLTGNRAASSGAVNVYSLYSTPVPTTVTFYNCTLSENEALVGAAMYAGELKQSGLQPGIQLLLRDVEITKNRILPDKSSGNLATTSKADSSAALELQSISIRFEGNRNLISNNYATAIHSQASVIYIHDHMVVCNNSGSFGGGMHLIAGSYIVLQNNSRLRLENNTGAVEGGAVYVNLLAFSPDFNYRDCFLFFEEVETLCLGRQSCSNVTALNFSLELIDNTAPLGSLIFGSTLETCPWSFQLKEEFNKPPSYPVLDIMYYEMKNKFKFSSEPTTVSAVTTPSTRLIIHNPPPVLEVAPGEVFYLNVSGYDHLGQDTPALVSSKPSTSIPNISSTLGFSNFSFLDSGYGDTVPVIVTGPKNTTDVVVYLFATDSYAQVEFRVNLTECAVGFEYRDGRCNCEPGLNEHSDIECNETSMELSIPNNRWAGLGPDGRSLIIAPCISDFCSAGERKVKPPDFDTLCHRDYHRAGVLCGQCAEGYSILLGSHHCKECNNNSLSLIILFAFAGIIIMFAISFLRITVSDGYLNSIFFYTNIISIYVPILSSTSRNASVFVLVAWLNLDYGIEQCFYDGMTALTHVALRLVFPVYLILLMAIIIFLSKKSLTLSHFFSNAQFSAAKLFATILLMSYATLLEVCLELVSPVIVRSVDERTHVLWRSDPNQKYFHGLHIPLMILACSLLFTVILPAPFLLMFPAITFRTCLGVRLKPILDAFWAPFKPKLRFFVGLRLLLRMIPYATAYLSPQPMNILFLGIFSISLLFLQVVIQPFRGFLQNTLDCFFLVNTIMLVMGALYFQIFITEHQENHEYVAKYHHEQYIFFALFVIMAYIAILLVILWHIQRRFPCIRTTLYSLVYIKRTHEMKGTGMDVGETTGTRKQ